MYKQSRRSKRFAVILVLTVNVHGRARALTLGGIPGLLVKTDEINGGGFLFVVV